MKPLREYTIHIAAAAIITVTAVLVGCSACTPRWYYRFQEQPTVAENTDTKTDTDEREGISCSYGYDSLSDRLREAYRVFADYVQRDYSERFTVALDNENEIENVLEAYEQDHPEVFWLNNSSRYEYAPNGDVFEVALSFSFEGENLREAKQQLADRIEDIFEAAPEDASDYEMELFLNKQIISYCEYDKDGPQRHNAYGALIQGRAVCDGYSKALQTLCLRAGIECVEVEGTASEFNSEVDGEEGDGHMWNCVKLGGDWYHVDVTWNDGEPHIQQYVFLNLSTEEIEKTHVIAPLYGEADPGDNSWLNTFVPECGSMEYNYFHKSCPCLSDLDEDSDVVAALIEAAKNRELYLDILVDDKLDYEETAKAISESYGYRWLEAANHFNGDDPKILEDSKYYVYEQTPVITFCLNYDD